MSEPKRNPEAPAAIILAAGKGTRMKSDLPKVLHPVCGRPMVRWVVDACRSAGCESILLVVGHQAERVREAFAGDDADLTFIEQAEQLGTGHAALCCRDALAGRGDQPVLVLAGDGPLIRAETLRTLLETHVAENAEMTLATCLMADAGAHGRILRDEKGELTGIVEYADADEAQRNLREANVSVYCFGAESLRQVAGRIDNDNRKGEYYITDALALLLSDGRRVSAVAAVPEEQVRSINTPEELREVERMLAARLEKETAGS
jgi:bifunctional UDP-N-acetylglucosamine pyrophosphorylase/glucosamine-1-phosphate N-acetyltransferase/UDP-N-acetylglucosamine pyrophosphorylase